MDTVAGTDALAKLAQDGKDSLASIRLTEVVPIGAGVLHNEVGCWVVCQICGIVGLGDMHMRIGFACNLLNGAL